MPHARLRQIYVAMVQARMLSEAGARRKGSAAVHEAAVVSTSVDLRATDLVSDADTSGPVAYLRGTSLTSLLLPKSLRPRLGRRRSGGVADCGKAQRLEGASGAERLWLAAGAGLALKNAAVEAKSSAPDAEQAADSGVIVVYVHPAEARGSAWRRVLAFAVKQELPLVFVVLPSVGEAKVSAGAMRLGLPAIAVDGNDAVALYRVAQESLGRARMGGGAALMECVAFTPERPPGRRKALSNPPEDAIAGMERYMLQRKVCTPAWMARVRTSFAARIDLAKATSIG